MKTPSLQLLGAAKTVTGSKTLLKACGKRILIDCGLFQGPKAIRELNWQDFPGAEKIDAVVLTHAHVDHCGYLPKLVKSGFTGPIYCSPGTKDLCDVILRDSAYLQEEDAKFANKTKHSRHHPAKPLYTAQDAERALQLFQPMPVSEWSEIFDGISVRLLRSGHVLGSTFVQISMGRGHKSTVITFSGDIGNGRQNVIKGPVSIVETDYLVMEGTYGDRIQPKVDVLKTLKECVDSVVQNKGVLVIPAFAVGRTQEILHLLAKLENEKSIPRIPVYLDSPMAIKATSIYLKHKDELKLQIEGQKFVEPFEPSDFHVVRSRDDSMRLCHKEGPMVVVSAAGMLTGGRILHHLKARLSDPANRVLFVGWQAQETKGRLLKQGLKKIRIHHSEVNVKAEIVTVDSLSAHGDSDDIINWIKGIEVRPKKVFLNHGEESSLNALSYRIKNELGLSSRVLSMGQEVELS